MIAVAMRSVQLLAAMIALSALVSVGGAPAQAAQRCITAKQCHGLLPQLCIKCKNGREGCAHWACVSHKCVVRYCSSNR